MSPQDKSLFIGNLPWNLNWEDLKEIFSVYGEVTYVKVVKDKETGRSKGFGFVGFANEIDAANAKFDHDGTEI
ncbi:MAG: RNA-binding protein, partial [Methylococcaceae bacterium]